MKQRVTRAGWCFAMASVLVGLAAFISANNLLFLLVAAMLATLLVSGLISRLTLAGLELDFILPEHISARRKVAARLILHNEKSWMPSFSIHVQGAPPSVFSPAVYFPLAPTRTRVHETVEVEFGRRGLCRENGFELSSRFPFGLTERRAQVTLRRDILVYPSLDPQPGFEDLLLAISGEIEMLQRGKGSDFYRIRPYQHLESSRHVDWRATAHTGEPQVREFAREQDPLVEIFLDLAVPENHTAWFERAVDCCAYLSWHAARRDARIRFRSQRIDLLVPAEGDIHALLKYLALASPVRNAAMLEPGEALSCRVVFSARSETAAERGWTTAHLLTPASLGG